MEAASPFTHTHTGIQTAPHPLLHGDFVVVADGVFPQEVELHHKLLAVVLRVQFDVFHSHRAAADRVGGLPLLLLVTRPQSQLEHTARGSHAAGQRGSEALGPRGLRHLVDEVEGHSSLSDPHLLGLPVFTVLGPDPVHTLLQSPGGFILLPVLLPLQNQKHNQIRSGIIAVLNHFFSI